MKKVMVVLAILILLGIVVKMQIGGGMRGGGMMHGGQGGNTQASQAATTGAEVFNVNCAGCHPNGGNSMTPNLPLKGSYKLVDVTTFVQFIRQPKMPDGSAGSMPAFPKSTISDEQATELFRYVSSL